MTTGLRTTLLFLCCTFPLWAVTVNPRGDAAWNANTRVAIIWNDGTGSAEMPGGWLGGTGDIGEHTRDFVRDALYHLSPENIREYHGQMTGWDQVTFSSITEDFGGTPPNAIIYVGAGWLWYQESWWGAPEEPYHILEEAADSGVGIVSIGDDAAYDAQYIFPLTGPGHEGIPVQYDSGIRPAMHGAAGRDTDVWIIPDHRDDHLLWGVSQDTLHFRDFEWGGRGQLDADIWDIRAEDVDHFFFSGFQQKATEDARFEYLSMDGGGMRNHTVVGSTPFDTIAPLGTRTLYDQGAEGYSYIYTVLAGMQFENNRLVLMCYQPQYLADHDAAAQIIYNSLYWVSRANEPTQIATPEADPSSGTVQEVDQVELSVAYPRNEELYEIRYTLDGTDPTEESPLYTGPISLPRTEVGVTLKAKAFSHSQEYWLDSEILVVAYGSVIPQIATPTATPDEGTTQSVETIGLDVAYPEDPALYTLYYSLDEEGSTEKRGYTGPITFPRDARDDVVLRAYARSHDHTEWHNSDTLVVVYPHVQGPVIDSAHFFPGEIMDFHTFERAEDTLHVFFDTPVSTVELPRPFNFIDEAGQAYQMELGESLRTLPDRRAAFTVRGFSSKPATYLPRSMKDSIRVNEEERLYSEDGVYQDGVVNPYAFLRVLPQPISLQVRYTWIDRDDQLSPGEIIQEHAVHSDVLPFEEGGFLHIDPRALLHAQEAEKMDCRVVILDALGNVVESMDSIHDHGENLRGTLLNTNGRYTLGVFWNGANRQGRRVGSSAYSAHVVFQNHRGDSRSVTVPVYAPAAQ